MLYKIVKDGKYYGGHARRWVTLPDLAEVMTEEQSLAAERILRGKRVPAETTAYATDNLHRDEAFVRTAR